MEEQVQAEARFIIFGTSYAINFPAKRNSKMRVKNQLRTGVYLKRHYDDAYLCLFKNRVVRINSCGDASNATNVAALPCFPIYRDDDFD